MDMAHERKISTTVMGEQSGDDAFDDGSDDCVVTMVNELELLYVEVGGRSWSAVARRAIPDANINRHGSMANYALAHVLCLRSCLWRKICR